MFDKNKTHMYILWLCSYYDSVVERLQQRLDGLKKSKVFTIWSSIEKSVNSYFRRKHAQDGKNKKDNQILVGPQEFNYGKRKEEKNINGGGELTGMTFGNLVTEFKFTSLLS